MKKLRAYPRPTTRRLSPKRKRGVFSTSRMPGSNSQFQIDLCWKGGRLRADVEAGDAAMIAPIRLAFDSIVAGRTGK